MVGVNMVGAMFVARAQSVIVTCVLGVFAVFVVVTVPSIDLDLLAFDGYPSASKIVASVALTFFAYWASTSSPSRPASCATPGTTCRGPCTARSGSRWSRTS